LKLSQWKLNDTDINDLNILIDTCVALYYQLEQKKEVIKDLEPQINNFINDSSDQQSNNYVRNKLQSEYENITKRYKVELSEIDGAIENIHNIINSLLNLKNNNLQGQLAEKNAEAIEKILLNSEKYINKLNLFLNGNNDYVVVNLDKKIQHSSNFFELESSPSQGSDKYSQNDDEDNYIDRILHGISEEYGNKPVLAKYEFLTIVSYKFFIVAATLS